MKKTLRSLITVLAVMIIAGLFTFAVSAAAVTEEGKCGNNVSYKIYDNGEIVISGTGDMYDWEWDGSPFHNNQKITSVRVEEGVTSIGAGAFSWCTKITEAKLPDTVRKIGSYAFYDCRSLEEINLPAVDKIDYWTFTYCRSLTSAIIPEGTENILNGAFKGCSNLSLAEFPESLKTVSDLAFADCTDLETLIFPAATEKIGVKAFENCADIALLTFEGRDTYIDPSAFNALNKDILIVYCLTDSSAARFAEKNDFYFVLSDDPLPHGSFFEGQLTDDISWTFDKKTGLLTLKGKGKMPDYLVSPFSILKPYATEIKIEGEIENLGNYVFSELSSVKTVTLNDGLKKIGRGAFRCCFTLKEITMPESVETLGSYAFFDCRKLETVKLSENISYIPHKAFFLCGELDNVEIPIGVKVIGTKAFGGCRGMKTIFFPGTIKEINDDAFIGALNIEKIYAEYEGYWKAVKMGNEKSDPARAGAKIFFLDNPNIPAGDVDGDGEVTAADARLVLRGSVGLEKLDYMQAIHADVDMSGAVEAADARHILRCSVGIEYIEK